MKHRKKNEHTTSPLKTKTGGNQVKHDYISNLKEAIRKSNREIDCSGQKDVDMEVLLSGITKDQHKAQTIHQQEHVV